MGTILDTKGAVMNKTKGMSSLCGVYVSVVETGYDLFQTKTKKLSLLGGDGGVDMIPVKKTYT